MGVASIETCIAIAEDQAQASDGEYLRMRAELATLRRKAAALDALRGPMGLTLGDCSPEAVAAAVPLARAKARDAGTFAALRAALRINGVMAAAERAAREGEPSYAYRLLREALAPVVEGDDE